MGYWKELWRNKNISSQKCNSFLSEIDKMMAHINNLVCDKTLLSLLQIAMAQERPILRKNFQQVMLIFVDSQWTYLVFCVYLIKIMAAD